MQRELTSNAPDPQPVLLARTLVQALGFLAALWLVARHAFGGLHRLLSFFIPVGVPGELGQAFETSRQLFVQRVFGHYERRTSLADVVRCDVFLADLADFSAFNEVYARSFPSEPPARVTVQAARLPKDARIEIAAIARLRPTV